MSAEIIPVDNALSFDNFRFLHRTVSAVESSAREVLVICEQSFDEASLIWAQARALKKKIEGQRKFLCEPERKRIAGINDRAKELTEPLEWVEDLLKSKIEHYCKSKEKERLEYIEEQKEAAEMLGVSTDVYVPELPSAKRGEGATAYKKTKKTYEISDFDLVPKRYLQVNMKLVEEDIKAGAHIPGIKIVEEETLQLRSR